jgi:hypothetical protein
MLEIMFGVHGMAEVSSVRITIDTVVHGTEPVYELRKASA